MLFVIFPFQRADSPERALAVNTLICDWQKTN